MGTDCHQLMTNISSVTHSRCDMNNTSNGATIKIEQHSMKNSPDSHTLSMSATIMESTVFDVEAIAYLYIMADMQCDFIWYGH